MIINYYPIPGPGGGLYFKREVQGGGNTMAKTKTKVTKLPTLKKVAKAVKAAKVEARLCIECKKAKPRTPRATRCMACQKAVRKEQLAANNITWKKNVAKGKAGHHKQYRGKPTVFAVLAKAAGLDPAKLAKPMQPLAKAVLKKIEMVAPVKVKTQKEAMTVKKDTKKGETKKVTAKKAAAAKKAPVTKKAERASEKRTPAKKAPAAKKAVKKEPKIRVRLAADGFNNDARKSPRPPTKRRPNKSDAAEESEAIVEENMPVQEKLHALDFPAASGGESVYNPAIQAEVSPF